MYRRQTLYSIMHLASVAYIVRLLQIIFILVSGYSVFMYNPAMRTVLYNYTWIQQPFITALIGYWAQGFFLLWGSYAYSIPCVGAYLWVAHYVQKKIYTLYDYFYMGILIALLCAIEAYGNVPYCAYTIPGGLLGSAVLYVLTLCFDTALVGFVLWALTVAVICMVFKLAGINYLGYGIKRVRSAYMYTVHPLLMYIKQGIINTVYVQKDNGEVLASLTDLVHALHNDVKSNVQDVHEIENDSNVVEYLQHKHLKKAPDILPIAMPIKDAVVENNQQDGLVENAVPLYGLPQADMLFSEKLTHTKRDALYKQEEQRAYLLEKKLLLFGVSGKVKSVKVGPVITLFEYEPDADAKISKIIALENDLALALQATSIRIIAPIPGKSVVGFEVSRAERDMVAFSTLVHTPVWQKTTHRIPIILGVNTIGEPVVVDLTQMPHVLIAGATGSGKSVSLATFLMSMLLKKTPDQLKLILIDPKQLECAAYHDIAHLLFPVITHYQDASAVLSWVVDHMHERYTAMAAVGARSIIDFNDIAITKGIEQYPYIVIVIDELADLMIQASKDIEIYIARLAQMARAAGIHLIVATQRPSVDVLTGTIKANFPSRIAFRVATKIDSRTIIDSGGAEMLLGKGDMLYLDAHGLLHRVHGAYARDAEIARVADHVRAQAKPTYCHIPQAGNKDGADVIDTDQKLFTDIVAYLKTVDEISISSLQRVFRIGYNRSARLIETLERKGMVSPDTGSKMRKVIKERI